MIKGRTCRICKTFKPLKDLVYSPASRHSRAKLCHKCHNIITRPNSRRQTKKRMIKRAGIRQETDELREEIIQVEINYYAEQEARIKQGGLKLGSEAGLCDRLLNRPSRLKG